MARFTESFDSYNGAAAPTGVRGRWIGSEDPTVVTGRFGGQAVRTISAASSIETSLGFSSNQFRMSMAFRCVSAGESSSGIDLSLGIGGSGSQVGIKYNSSSGLWSLTRGGTASLNGTQLWQSIDSYVLNVWHTLRLRGVIHSSAGSLEFMVDNDILATLTGINTQALGSALIDRVFLYGNNNRGDCEFDDIVIENDASSHLPECRIQQFLPNSDGSTLDLTPSTGVNHYAVVDEPTVNTSDYLSGTSVGDLDLLGVQDLSVIPASILGVKLVGFANKTDAASRAWNLGIESSGTVDNGPDLSLTTDIQYYEHDFEEDPHTSSEWTQSGFNAIQIQPRVAV